MIGRNIRLLTIVVLACLVCAVQAKRYRDVNDLALAMDMVEQLYVKPVDRAELGRNALSGMMQGLDPYSGYIPPQELEAFRSQIEQNFAGLGIVITKKQGSPLRIVRILHDSPAEKAGLQVGELIEAINDQPSRSMSSDQATSMLRGAPDTAVNLTIKSADDVLRTVSVSRAMIETPSIIGDHRDSTGKTVYRMQAAGNVAYVHMSVFGEQSTREMRAFLETTRLAQTQLFGIYARTRVGY